VYRGWDGKGIHILLDALLYDSDLDLDIAIELMLIFNPGAPHSILQHVACFPERRGGEGRE
jgi:hypothetical protein